MQERALSPLTRIAAAVLGAGIFIIGFFVAASQVRAGWGSDIRAWLAAVAVLIVAIAGARLIRAAVRGTITVRGRAAGKGR